MALLNEMAGSQPCAIAIVQRDAALLKTGNDPVDQHHAGDLFQQRDQLAVGEHFCVYHERRAAMADQLFDRLTLFLLIMVAVANQQKIAGVISHLFHCFYHRTKERIGNIAHHQTDCFGGLLRQRPCVSIWVIVQLFHGALHRRPRRLAGFGRGIDNT